MLPLLSLQRHASKLNAHLAPSQPTQIRQCKSLSQLLKPSPAVRYEKTDGVKHCRRFRCNEAECCMATCESMQAACQGTLYTTSKQHPMNFQSTSISSSKLHVKALQNLTVQSPSQDGLGSCCEVCMSKHYKTLRCSLHLKMVWDHAVRSAMPAGGSHAPECGTAPASGNLQVFKCRGHIKMCDDHDTLSDGQKLFYEHCWLH